MPETAGKPTPAEERNRPSPQVVPGPRAVSLRVLQANERTLLAWIRTGLALMAFGFVVARLGMWLHATQSTPVSGSWSGWIGSAFVVLGTVSNTLAALRYVRIRRAVIEGRAIIPGNAAVLSLALGLVILGAILVGYLATR